jgi:hypothetical protein
MTPPRSNPPLPGYGQIMAQAQEHVADNSDWLILNEPPIVIVHHDGEAVYLVASWIKVMG